MINLIIAIVLILIGIGIMCIFQINRDNELQNRINRAIELMYDKATFNLNDKYGKVFLEFLKILGGDVDE